MTGWTDHLVIAPILVPLLAGALTVLAGEDRLLWDADPNYVTEESAKHWRKNARDAE